MNFQLSADHIEMVWRLLAALFAGALIGYERSYNGRPAGFRTHALVCMSSSLLMLVTVYEATWVRSAPGEIQARRTRMCADRTLVNPALAHDLPDVFSGGDTQDTIIVTLVIASEME